MLKQCKQKYTKSVYDYMTKEIDAFLKKAYQKHKSELDIELSKKTFFIFPYSFN